jgi:hypothetical protein
MTKLVQRRHDAQTRTNSVCAEHTEIFDATPGGRKTRATLAANVAHVDDLLVAQVDAIHDKEAATALCRQMRVQLHRAIKAVVTIGKVVHLDETTMATLRRPGAIKDDELIAFAGCLHERVLTHAEAFLAEGLPAVSLTDLAEGIRVLSTARQQQASARQRFSAAAESIRDAQEAARVAIRTLGVIVENTPAAHPEVTTKLKFAKRIGHRARKDAPLAAALEAPSAATSLYAVGEATNIARWTRAHDHRHSRWDLPSVPEGRQRDAQSRAPQDWSPRVAAYRPVEDLAFP